MNAKTSFLLLSALAASAALARPIREWDWRMPAEVYRDLEFSDRAGVDRATKFFQEAADAEDRGTKVTDLVPRYRNAEGEWRKVQIRGEAGELNPALLAYAVFMQGYASMQAHDRNKATKLFDEVLDLYPEQKFIAVPARYMLSRIRREMGDVRQANEILGEIADDAGAEGHVIYYNVLRDRAANRAEKGDLAGARDDFRRVVRSTGKVDRRLRDECRCSLVALTAILGDFGEMDADIFGGVADETKARREHLGWFAWWFAAYVDNDGCEFMRYVNAKFPRDKKASEFRATLDKAKRGFAAWFDGEAPVFEGDGDGWRFAFAKLRVHARVDKPAEIQRRVREIEPIVKNAKGADRNARAAEVVGVLADARLKEAGLAAVELGEGILFKLRQSATVVDRCGDYKACVAYLEEYVHAKPGPEPEDLKRAKYDLGWTYRVRLGQSEKALKVYEDLDDPPRSLWVRAEAYRECGRKAESYKCLTEIVGAFPKDAPAATLRTAQWREQDGEKEKAIALYRRVLSHPKWKETRESSEAHQALERLGIATGGAMTNQVR